MRRGIVAAAVIQTTGLVIACDMPGRPPIVELRSPRATYTVRLSGRVQAPRNPFVYHSVWADVFKDKTQYVLPQKIHEGDSFDASFDSEYTGNEWFNESVLRFKSAIAGEKTGVCEVTIVNGSTLSIRFLRLKAEDLFLLIDIRPRTEVPLEAACWLRSDLSWLEVQGEWSDGSPIPWTGVNFVLSASASEKLRYRITFNSGAAEIAEVGRNSPVYKGAR